jgi:hypothetical protein
MTHRRKSLRELQAEGQAELASVQGRTHDGKIDWDGRWHSAGDWCVENLPDLIDRTTNSACGFAVGSALRLRSELGRTPTPAEVRARRREWMRRLKLDPAANVRPADGTDGETQAFAAAVARADGGVA